MTKLIHLETALVEVGEHYREFHRQIHSKVKKPATGSCPKVSILFKNKKLRKSSAPFDSLQRTSLKLLKLNEVAVGKYLLLRILEEPYTIENSIVNVVEDHLGYITFLFMYHTFIGAYDEVYEIFRIGTMLIVKEPYFEMTKQCFAIQVECETDVIVLRHSLPDVHKIGLAIPWMNELDLSGDLLLAEPKPVTAEDWRKRGNELFSKHRYYIAVDAYFLCIKYADESNDKQLSVIAKNNLAAAYLNLEEFENAINMCFLVLEQFPQDHKALYRAGQSLYAYQNYKLASEYFKKLVDAGSKNNLSKLEQAEKRMEESRGKFNLEKLREAIHENPGTFIDIGNYLGPVERSETLGVIATKDIPVGTVIVVSKALAAVLGGSNLDNSEKIRRITEKVGISLRKNLKMYEVTLNSYNNQEFLSYCDPENEKEPVIDACELSDFISRRSFYINHYDQSLSIRNSSGGRVLVRGLPGRGFFTFPANFQHSCLPNCYFQTFNNVMVIRTLWPIEAGEVLTLNYLQLHKILDSSKRRQSIEKKKLNCSCNLCTWDTSEPANWVQKRVKKIRKLPDYHVFDSESVAAVESNMREIELIYRKCKRKMLPTDMFMPCMLLRNYYSEIDENEKLREVSLKLLKCFGFEVDDLKKITDDGLPKELYGNVYLSIELLHVLESLICSYDTLSGAMVEEATIVYKAAMQLKRMFSLADATLSDDNSPTTSLAFELEMMP